MKVQTDITRMDLMRFNLLLLPRIRSTYVMIGIIALAVFIYLVWDKGFPNTNREWLFMIFASTGGGIGGMVGGTVVSFICILFSSSKSNGTLGIHDYEITSDGLVERTVANEGLSRWSGIQEVRHLGPYLLFRISGYLFHIIPKRSFENEEEFNAFKQKSKDYWNNAV